MTFQLIMPADSEQDCIEAMQLFAKKKEKTSDGSKEASKPVPKPARSAPAPVAASAPPAAPSLTINKEEGPLNAKQRRAQARAALQKQTDAGEAEAKVPAPKTTVSAPPAVQSGGGEGEKLNAAQRRAQARAALQKPEVAVPKVATTPKSAAIPAASPIVMKAAVNKSDDNDKEGGGDSTLNAAQRRALARAAKQKAFEEGTAAVKPSVTKGKLGERWRTILNNS